ncbi:MAG: DUF1801 domain-containing protein [Paracoccaceae bacterium]
MTKKQNVEGFLDELSHKRIGDIRALRRIVLEADPAITERVKWNAPSFCWKGVDRITMRLQPGDRLELIFHRGAKTQDSAGFAFDDPTGRIEWVTPDRGVFRVGDLVQEQGDITRLTLAWMISTAN